MGKLNSSAKCVSVYCLWLVVMLLNRKGIQAKLFQLITGSTQDFFKPQQIKKDFKNKYFIVVDVFCIQVKKLCHNCNSFLAIPMWSFHIYILYPFISMQ